MPYIATEGETVAETDSYYIVPIIWEREGQCVAHWPNAQYRIHNKDCRYGWNSITVEARARHTAFKMAVRIADNIAATQNNQQG